VVLAEAFHEDAMFRFIEPDPDRRRRVLPWFFGAALRLGRQSGRVDVHPDHGAAIWLPPGRTSLGPIALARSGLALAPVRLGLPAFRRFTRLTSAFEAAGVQSHGDVYWHVFILGVAPGHQGQGVGGRLLEPVLALADTAGQDCYLETTEEHNLAFYRRHGFEIAITRQASDLLPESWTMLRRARPPADPMPKA
jgi:ribosomal protein S18 acetylase RimI-like enzyme